MTLFPPGFKIRMQQTLGDEWDAFEKAHAEPSPVSIRINPSKHPEVKGAASIPWSTSGFYLDERPVFTLDPLFHAGCYYVQEASSMFLEQAIRQHVLPAKKLRILDLCAAPGGKSTHLLSLIDSDSLLVTNEVIRSRVNVLSENIQKWGHHNVVVTNNDPEDFGVFHGFFDVIIIDAPCSGEGLFRKDPNAMQEWSEENVLLCSNRQQRIIDNVWPALKQNGILIYSTCTYNESEDEKILQYAKNHHPLEFLPLDTHGWNIEQIENSGTIGYRFYPHRVIGEGFFLSVMKKVEEETPLFIKPSKSAFSFPEKRVRDEVQEWLINAAEYLIQRNDLVQLLPALHAETIYYLTQKLRVVYAGTFIAAVKHNKLVPEHSFALANQMKREKFNDVVLNEKEALQYLKKETVPIQPEQKGFALATFNGVPLGWMNVLPGRINNLYPSEWRIRMQIS
jgi:16S rRNA C967 or C1407 C5-methylase (RsmB/RsmF family)/NOL1/NOP2/fmu family ribosome biogenesis protein